MPPLPERTRRERRVGGELDRVRRQRGLPAGDLDHQVVAGLGDRAGPASVCTVSVPFSGPRLTIPSPDRPSARRARPRRRAAAPRSRARRARGRRSSATPAAPTNAPSSHSQAVRRRARARRPRAAAPWRGSSRAALAIASGVRPDGLVLKPCPVPKRFSSAGTTLTSSAGTPSSSATSWAYRPSLPSASVVRLSTIFPVGWTRRKTARYASSATAGSPLVVLLALEPLPLLVRRQRVVVLAVAEARLRPAARDAGARRGGRSRDRCRSWSCRPPGGGVAAARAVAARHRDRAAGHRRGARHGSSASGSGTSGAQPGAPRSAAIASTTSPSASRLWPLTSASMCGSAASHAAGPRGEVRRAHARVDPHDPVGQARKALHLAADERRVAPFPPVGQDDDHGAARHPAAAVAVVERPQRLADTRPARPVGRRGGGTLDCALGAARGERPGHTGQTRREHERLGVARRPRR